MYQQISPIKCHCCPHIQTSLLICCTNQLSGSYMRDTLTFNGLSNLESKVDKLDVDKLIPVPVDLSKLSDAVKNYVVYI